MTSLDTSAVASIIIEDHHSPAIWAWLATGPAGIALSAFAAAEFAAVVGRRVRTREYRIADARRALALFDDWVTAHARMLEMAPEDHRVAAGFVRRFELGLRAPDALHIAVCQRLRLPLLTFDKRQAAAARQLGVVCDDVAG